MKKSFLFFSLFSLFCIAMPYEALAKKKYRYIKREHGVKFNLSQISWENPSTINLDLEGAYAFNMGMFEFGPYFGLEYMGKTKYHAGLLMEYNFVKNRGRRKFVPAFGLKLAYVSGNELSVFPQMALKYFVGKRTSLSFILGPQWQGNFTFKNWAVIPKVHASAGFSYYFDFY